MTQKLGKLLINKGIINEAQFKECTKHHEKTKESLGQALVSLNYITEMELLKSLSELSGLPYIDLSNYVVPTNLLDAIPVKFVVQKEIIPLERKDNILKVAVSDHLDIHSIDELRLLIGCDIQPVIGSEKEIKRIIKSSYGVGADTVNQMVEDRKEDLTVLSEELPQDGDVLEMAEQASLIKFVNQILIEAIQERATDIHVEPYEKELRIRYRTDGVLHKIALPPQIQNFQPAIVSRIKIMAQLNIAEKRLPQDGRIKLQVGGREIDIRVSIIPTLFGENVVLRLLDKSSVLYPLDSLGMRYDHLKIFEKMILQPYGIILVTGPTGSGKTTTLYSALNKINTLERHIITIEDPVEYYLPGINQIQVKTQIGLTFASGLRNILRHDPNIIMIGEIRDLDTAEIAIQSALTGHLVFSTLHTNDAPSAITRLVDMGMEAYLLSSSIEGVMSQRLVRVICKECKEEYTPEQKTNPLSDEQIKTLYKGRGCEKCRGTGYRGRMGIFELLTLNEELKELIVSNAPANKIRQVAIKQGMRTLRQDGWEKVKEGVTTINEVLTATKMET